MQRWLISAGLALVVGLLWGAEPASAQTTVYSEDFDGGLTVGPGVSASFPENPSFSGRQVVGSFAGYGSSGNQFSGNWLRTAGTNGHTLTLTGLPTHSNVSVGFLLGILDTWDFTAGENITVKVDGVTKFNDVFGYGGEEGSAATGATELVTGLAGPGYGQLHSTGYDLGALAALQNIPHTSSTLVVNFDGVIDQFGNDESWSMDNLRVTLDAETAVPEPGALALFVPALGLVALLKRRRSA